MLSIFFLGPIVIFPDSYTNPEWMGMGELIGYSIMLLAMLCVFFGVRRARLQSDGPFGFSKALITGLLITGVANLIFYLANVFLYEVIAPDFLENFMAFYKDYMIENAAPGEREVLAAEFEQQRAMMTNAWIYAMIMAGTTVGIGIIISLISAAVFGRKTDVSREPPRL